MTNWDQRFTDLAQHISGWSKDPSTKCGAVLVRPDRTIASTGFNGFAKDMYDIEELYKERKEKYSRVIHAEMNALHFCRDQSIYGYTLYTWPFLCCDRCAVHIIQAGIKRVVAPDLPKSLEERWGESIRRSIEYFDEACVYITLLKERNEY